MNTRHPSVSPDHDLIADYAADCSEAFWTGIAVGAAIVALVWGIVALS